MALPALAQAPATNGDSRLGDQFIYPVEAPNLPQDASKYVIVADAYIDAYYVSNITSVKNVSRMSSVTSEDYSSEYWKSIIISTAEKYGANENLLLKIAECESGFKPNAKNSSSTASGLFQFLDSTWQSQSQKYGILTEKNDPYGQIEVAARMIADGGLSHWDASKSCWSNF